jgi:hypothetical protein
VLDFDEFLKLYKSCLSNAKVRDGKDADKMTLPTSVCPEPVSVI